jgi:inorganic pyrophosphatase
MSFNSVPPGKNVPDDIYVIIEIPANSSPVKYEIDKDSDALFVDRFMTAPMFYPANYGYINGTLADDGDAVDVLVVTPYPVSPGSVIRCRPIGVLNMTDESGIDVKLLAVPHEKLSKEYGHVQEISDLPPLLVNQIKLFFETYKTIEPDKWVKVEQWADSQAAKKIIKQGIDAYYAAEEESLDIH